MPRVERKAARRKRHMRLRNRVVGTPERPRLNVYRSLNHIYAQVIDDTAGRTLAAASTLDPELKDRLEHTANQEAAKAVGELVGKRALENGVKQVTFDRGGNQYAGRIKALAEGAREAGLDF
ncbi:MAG: 50S ribosomal protein L18 [Firmicutes bacterium]|nr:50S ribosomal protein L18 [Bacillota bacterium]